MALKLPVSGGGGDFKRLPAGSHIAICNLIADLGLQPGSAAFPNPKRQVYVRFEIPAERVEWEKDGVKHEGPQVIGKSYTASMNEKANLRKHLEGWRGKNFTDAEAEDFDLASVLGKPCMLIVSESENGGKTYSNIASVGPMPKGIPAPTSENELLMYDDDNDHKTFNKLPPWLQEKIEKQIKETVSADEE